MFVRKIDIETIINSINKDLSLSDAWLVYGHSDIMRTDILNYPIQEISSIFKKIPSCDDEKFLFESIYYNNLQDHKYNQTFYLLGNHDDQLFWHKAKEANFTLIYFVTLNCLYDLTTDVKNYESLFSFYDKNYEQLKIDNIMMYTSLDNYDCIIIGHNNDLDKLTIQMSQFINDIMNKYNRNLTNSHLRIVDIRDVYKMYMSHYNKINESALEYTKIKQLNIQIKVNTHDQINQLKKDIQNDLPASMILQTGGSKDYLVDAKDVSYDTLFSLYRTTEKIGILAINSDYRKNIIKSTNLKFCLDDNEKNRIQMKTYKQLELIKMFEKKVAFEKIGKIKNNLGLFYGSELEGTYQSLKGILYQSLPNYGFLSMYLPFKKFLEKCVLYTSKYQKSFEKDIDFFIETSHEILRISDSSQVNHYPSKPYIYKDSLTPVKLICFYSAFLWKLKETIISLENINDNINRQFCFCVKPTIHQNVVMKTLFKEDKKVNDRLLFVEIPMKFMFTPKLMLFYLCHEEAHYVGEIVRNRKIRAKHIKKAYFIYLINNLCLGISRELTDKYGIVEILKDFFSDGVDKYSNISDELENYSEKLKKTLRKASLLLNQSISKNLLKRIKTNKIKEDNIKKSSSELSYIILRLQLNANNLFPNNKFMVALDKIIYYFSESFSDLFAILILEVEKNFYNECIINSINSIDDIMESEDVYVRVMSVLFALMNDDSDEQFIKDTVGTKYDRYKAYMQNNSTSWYDATFSPEMIYELVEYLKVCQQTFNSLEKKPDSLFDQLKSESINYATIDNLNSVFKTAIINSLRD